MCRWYIPMFMSMNVFRETICVDDCAVDIGIHVTMCQYLSG